VVLGAGDDDGGSYKVRAIFDNAGFVIPGEDVKVAGVKVGVIDSIDVTDDFKAAVVSTSPTRATRTSARTPSVIVRPQSLIGERFVECERRRRARRDRAAAAAEEDRRRAGQGAVPAPGRAHGKTVDLDLINNIMREPVGSACRSSCPTSASASPGRGDDLTRSSVAPTRR
jgi:hypothetical protein